MTRRQMARPVGDAGPTRLRDIILLGAAGLAVLVGLITLVGIVAGSGSAARTPATSPPTVAAGESPAGQASPANDVPAGQATPAPSADGSGSPRTDPTQPSATSPVPTATPPLTGGPGAAPTSAEGFDIRGQVIPIGFPLLRETEYTYRDNFLDLRDGVPDAYNHARLREDGTSVRLHDGTDIYAEEGEPLVAVFDGTVIDPASRWEPWEPERYGRTIVIVSDEPTSVGYIALYAHVDRAWVKPGTHVTRGQVLGTVGRTGNAELQSIRPHLHFELRAPFLLDWTELGEERQVDAFNPYLSLRAADPKRG